MPKVSEQVVVLEEQLKEVLHELEVARSEVWAGTGQAEGEVTLIGGPKDQTKMMVLPEDLRRGELAVAVASPSRLGHWTYGAVDSAVRTGWYQLIQMPTRASHRPFNIGIWQGVR
jgi:hypothetical protein